MRPPRAWTLLGLGKPSFDVANEWPADPVAVFDLVRGVDHAGNMTGTGDDERDRAAEKFRAQEYRFRRRDMILACRQAIDRSGDVAEIDLLTGEHYLAFRELVIEITVSEIERMTGRGNPRPVRIPAQEVE